MRHEQAVADSFNSFMRQSALDRGCKFHSFALDGQDRDAGADYLLTDSDQFCLIEFKYSDTELITENKKVKRLRLCKALESDSFYRKLHDKCHFISWAERKSEVKLNIYRREICNRLVFGGNCGLKSRNIEAEYQEFADTFSDKFFNPIGSGSLGYADFQKYLTWLLIKVSQANASFLELVAHNPSAKRVAIVKLSDLGEVRKWVKDHF